MIHYTCDHCKRPIDPRNEVRYIVKMEVYASLDPAEDVIDGDRDELLEIQEILERLDDVDDDQIGDDVYQQLRYDLCSECRKKFVSAPLGTSSAKQFDFSNN
ncbi:MAG: hypothetical protein KDA42_15265 [Planctomycetales bacterium]|nr:hypothetical protein [Planctomycetales bacterium]